MQLQPPKPALERAPIWVYLKSAQWMFFLKTSPKCWLQCSSSSSRKISYRACVLPYAELPIGHPKANRKELLSFQVILNTWTSAFKTYLLRENAYLDTREGVRCSKRNLDSLFGVFKSRKPSRFLFAGPFSVEIFFLPGVQTPGPKFRLSKYRNLISNHFLSAYLACR